MVKTQSSKLIEVTITLRSIYLKNFLWPSGIRSILVYVPFRSLVQKMNEKETLLLIYTRHCFTVVSKSILVIS